MTYIKDLDPCTYGHQPDPKKLAIGWLDESQPFTKIVKTSDSYFMLCNALKMWTTNFFELKVLHRGSHRCQFCTSVHPKSGNGQIWVKGEHGITYIAPTLVGHYVYQHSYCPPEEFIVAVMNSKYGKVAQSSYIPWKEEREEYEKERETWRNK